MSLLETHEKKCIIKKIYNSPTQWTILHLFRTKNASATRKNVQKYRDIFQHIFYIMDNK